LEDPDDYTRDSDKQDPYDSADDQIARLAIDEKTEVEEADEVLRG